MIKKLIGSVAGLALYGMVVSNAQALIVAGETFDDNAFADVIISSSALSTFSFGTATLEDAVLGSNTDTFVDYRSGAFIEFGFTDNVVINGTGVDLVLFDLFDDGDGAFVSLTVGGTIVSFDSSDFVDTGFNNSNGIAITRVDIDLDLFGVASGATISSIVVGYRSPEVAAIGALNSRSVPEPTTLALMGLGLAGIGYRRQHNKKVA